MRLFAGIALDDAARAACVAAIDDLRRAGFAAKFEAPEKLHVTLAFLGNVADERRDEIVAAMTAAAARTTPFEIVLDRAGAFPHERAPRIIYVGSRDQGPAYRGLSSAVRQAYGELGFTFKDDAVAHVTIARVKAPTRPLPLVNVAPTRLRVSELSLFESIFDKEKNTSRYVIDATATLRS